MKVKTEPFFKTGLVYKLALTRFFGLGILLYPILWFNFYLYIIILSVLTVTHTVFLRCINFYDSHIEIYFPCRPYKKRKKVEYGDLNKISYMYSQYGGLPMIKMVLKNRTFLEKLNDFIVNCFVLGNRAKVVHLLVFLKSKHIEIQIKTTSNSKQELLDRINQIRTIE